MSSTNLNRPLTTITRLHLLLSTYEQHQGQPSTDHYHETTPVTVYRWAAPRSTIHWPLSRDYTCYCLHMSSTKVNRLLTTITRLHLLLSTDEQHQGQPSTDHYHETTPVTVYRWAALRSTVYWPLSRDYTCYCLHMSSTKVNHPLTTITRLHLLLSTYEQHQGQPSTDHYHETTPVTVYRRTAPRSTVHWPLSRDYTCYCLHMSSTRVNHSLTTITRLHMLLSTDEQHQGQPSTDHYHETTPVTVYIWAAPRSTVPWPLSRDYTCYCLQMNSTKVNRLLTTITRLHLLLSTYEQHQGQPSTDHYHETTHVTVYRWTAPRSTVYWPLSRDYTCYCLHMSSTKVNRPLTTITRLHLLLSTDEQHQGQPFTDHYHETTPVTVYIWAAPRSTVHWPLSRDYTCYCLHMSSTKVNHPLTTITRLHLLLSTDEQHQGQPSTDHYHETTHVTVYIWAAPRSTIHWPLSRDYTCYCLQMNSTKVNRPLTTITRLHLLLSTYEQHQGQPSTDHYHETTPVTVYIWAAPGSTIHWPLSRDYTCYCLQMNSTKVNRLLTTITRLHLLLSTYEQHQGQPSTDHYHETTHVTVYRWTAPRSTVYWPLSRDYTCYCLQMNSTKVNRPLTTITRLHMLLSTDEQHQGQPSTDHYHETTPVTVYIWAASSSTVHWPLSRDYTCYCLQMNSTKVNRLLTTITRLHLLLSTYEQHQGQPSTDHYHETTPVTVYIWAAPRSTVHWPLSRDYTYYCLHMSSTKVNRPLTTITRLHLLLSTYEQYQGQPFTDHYHETTHVTVYRWTAPRSTVHWPLSRWPWLAVSNGNSP